MKQEGQGSPIVFLSGGLGSFLAADMLLKDEPRSRLLFTDTLIEDADLYRFLDDIEAAWDKEIIRIADGRTPWEVFNDVKMLGNSRIDPCSRVLKRELAKKWVREHGVGTIEHSPNEKWGPVIVLGKEYAPVVVGIGWQEIHRMTAIKNHWRPHYVMAPLIDDKVADVKRAALDRLAYYGIEPPRLYGLGFHHNNCGGWCIKAGHGQFATLLEQLPQLYMYHEQKENEFRENIGKNVSILRDRTGGETKPMTMQTFRERIQSGCAQVDMFDIGGCGCFV